MIPSSPESEGYEHSHTYEVIISDHLRSYVMLLWFQESNMHAVCGQAGFNVWKG